MMTPQKKALKHAVEKQWASVIIAGGSVKNRVSWLQGIIDMIPHSDRPNILIDPTRQLTLKKGVGWLRKTGDIESAIKLGLRLDVDSMVIAEAPPMVLASLFTMMETGHQVVISSDRDDARDFLKEFVSTVAKLIGSGTPPSEAALIGGLLRRPLLLLNVTDTQTLSGFFRAEIRNAKVEFVTKVHIPAKTPTPRPPPKESWSSVRRNRLKAAKELLLKKLKEGFDADKTILDSMLKEAAQNVEETDAVRSEIAPLVQKAIAAQNEREKSWPAVTDCDRLNRAFAALEKHGVMARQNFSCCGSCSEEDIGQELAKVKKGRSLKGYVFFHNNDLRTALEHQVLKLSYGPASVVKNHEAATQKIGMQIYDALKACGLSAKWDKNPDHLISIAPIDWKRRRPTEKNEKVYLPRSLLR